MHRGRYEKPRLLPVPARSDEPSGDFSISRKVFRTPFSENYRYTLRLPNVYYVHRERAVTMLTAYRGLSSRVFTPPHQSPEGGSENGGGEIIDAFSDIETTGASIAVVGEDERAREVYCSLLESGGYVVAWSGDSREAVTKIRETAPDVVVVDSFASTCMELCHRLRSDPELSAEPIVISSSIAEGVSRTQLLESGVFDFFTTPIRPTEFLLRVRNAVVARYLTDRAAYGEKLEHEEQLRDSLTHMLVHDLRQPVQALNLSLELLNLQVTEEDEKSLVTSSLAVVKRITAMLQSLLDVNKLEEGKVELRNEPVRLAALAEDVVAELDPLLSNHNVAIDAPSEVSAVDFAIEGDTELIRRAITNLLVNAAENTPADGSIRIGMREDSSSVTIVVSDTGRGVPSEFRHKIFEKFGQISDEELPKKHSPGLGLPFCKLVAEAHDGEIGVESEPGKGSSFWMRFPRTTDA